MAPWAITSSLLQLATSASVNVSFLGDSFPYEVHFTYSISAFAPHLGAHSDPHLSQFTRDASVSPIEAVKSKRFHVPVVVLLFSSPICGKLYGGGRSSRYQSNWLALGPHAGHRGFARRHSCHTEGNPSFSIRHGPSCT